MSQDASSPRRLAFSALLDACRIWLGKEATGALGDPRFDWDTFENLAFVHNLEPLLHHLRAEADLRRRDIPLALCDRWEKAYFENFVFNTRALEIIQPFCDACEENALPIAVIKGPVISARVYGDLALRIMVDLDLLCRERDLPDLARLARHAGFIGGDETAVYHARLWHQELPLPLELHFKLYEFLPDAATRVEDVLDSAEPCRLGDDFVFPAPAAHLETAIEIAHLVHHDLRVNLKPLLDLAGSLGVLASSTALKQTLADWDLEPEAAIIGRLLERLFGFETDLVGGAAPSHGSRIVDAAAGDIERIETRPRPALEELTSRPGLRAKLGYLGRLLMPPPRRLEAVSGTTDRPRTPFRLAHVLRTLRRGWAKLARAGIASAAPPSIKREVFRRRTRR